jgi:hypothetical protein
MMRLPSSLSTLFPGWLFGAERKTFHVLGGLLLLLVACARHLLLFNEETLVALAFFSFVAVVWTQFGQTIAGALDERGSLLHQELQQSLTRQGALLQAVRREGQQAGQATEALQTLRSDTLQHLHQWPQRLPLALENGLKAQVLDRFQRVQLLQGAARPQVLQALAQALPKQVLVTAATQETLLEEALDQALHLLRSAPKR